MTVTLNINGVPTEVELTEDNLREIVEAKKPKTFEFKYPTSYYYVDTINYTNVTGYCTPGSFRHGRYRLTAEVAQQSLDRNRRTNRLEALAEQLGGLLDWKVCEPRFYVYLLDSTYSTGKHETTLTPGIIYMTQDCAKEICRMLNAGEFEL